MPDNFLSILENIKIPEHCEPCQFGEEYLDRVKTAWKTYADQLNAERLCELQKEIDRLNHQIYMIRTMRQIAQPYGGYRPIWCPPEAPTSTGSNAIKAHGNQP